MPDLPTGTVTLLFTDIEGSTRLLQRLGERYAAVLRDHHRLLRLAFGAWDGVEVDNQGDSFFVAFATAAAATEIRMLRDPRRSTAPPLRGRRYNRPINCSSAA